MGLLAAVLQLLLGPVIGLPAAVLQLLLGPVMGLPAAVLQLLLGPVMGLSVAPSATLAKPGPTAVGCHPGLTAQRPVAVQPPHPHTRCVVPTHPTYLIAAYACIPAIRGGVRTEPAMYLAVPMTRRSLELAIYSLYASSPALLAVSLPSLLLLFHCARQWLRNSMQQ